MKAQLRAEFLKERSTSTLIGLLAGLLGLVLLVIVLHGVALSEQALARKETQLSVMGRGEFLATLFAALLGALSITSEIRHGTIRPTFLVTPWRGRVIAAKVLVSAILGAGFGLAACSLAAALATALLRARGIDVQVGMGDYALLIGGGTAATALWAALGVGLGAVIRQQVPTLIGLCAWLLFIEGLLVGDAGVLGDVGRFLPGAAAMALGGAEPATRALLSPGWGALVLGLYVLAATAAGWVATTRRDVA